MKKIQLYTIFLLAALMIISLSGCSLRTMDARLDALEEAVEHRADAAENAVEAAIVEAIRPEPTPPATAQKQTKSAKTASPVIPTPTAKLTKEEAEAIVLEYAGFTADQVSHLRTEYEIDDRIPQYDIQFWEGRWEYEFEIHAETGKILSFDKDT